MFGESIATVPLTRFIFVLKPFRPSPGRFLENFPRIYILSFANMGVVVCVCARALSLFPVQFTCESQQSFLSLFLSLALC
jgi:hypothetical protein